jgi:hypothetical protein
VDDDEEMEEEFAKQKLLQQKAGRRLSSGGGSQHKRQSKLKVPDLKVPDNGPKKAGSLLSNFFGVNKKIGKKQ